MIQKYLERNEWMQETILVQIGSSFTTSRRLLFLFIQHGILILENVVRQHSCEFSLNHSINTVNSQAV